MNYFNALDRDGYEPASSGDQSARTGRGEITSQRPPVITQILSVIRRRKYIILGSIAAALAIGLVLSLLVTRKYTAIAIIEIQRETGSFVKVEGAEQKDNFLDQEFYQTQYGLLQSDTLSQRVATRLKLYDNAQFFDMYGVSTEKWVVNGRFRPDASSRLERVRAAGTVLQRNFAIEPKRLSRLVEINFTSADPVLSKRIVDEWSKGFIQITLERKFEATSYARNFLETKLSQLRGRIDQSERNLVDYASREGIVNLPASSQASADTGPAPERSLVADNLAALNSELSKATADRARAQSRLNAPAGSVTEALENLAIGNLRQNRAQLSAEYAKLQVQFEPDYPPAKALKSQIDQLDVSIKREESRVQGALRETYSASVARESDLANQVKQLKTGVLDLRRRTIQYDIYKRDVDTNQQLYDALLQRYKEIGVAGGVGVNNIAVVDPAQVPLKPSSPNVRLNLLLALLVGLAIGAGAAFALEQMDQGIVDPGEVEPTLGVPLLGTIPKSADNHPVEALRDRKSSVSEAYLSLQTNLGFTTDHGVPSTLAITSTRPAEGKTTTAFAVADSLARSKRRVLLIDGDMRSPSIHHLFDLPNLRGLSNYLSGDDGLAGLIHPIGESSLSVMTAGPQPPSAAELLSGNRLAKLREELGASFDHIVIDSPPVMGLADAPLFGGGVEGVIFVVESHSTQKNMAQVAVGRLLAGNATILGAVLTKFDLKRAHYGYGYDYGYGYGYGETGSAKE